MSKTQLQHTLAMQEQRDQLWIAAEKALEYIIDHCHEFVPAERQSTYVPNLLRVAIDKAKGGLK